MKILRIIARLNVGGPARHVVWLSDRLKSLGYTTTLLAGTVPNGEEDMAYFADENGVKPVFIKEMSRELSSKDVVSLFKVFRIMLQEHPDIIHTHTAKAGTVGRIAAFAYRWVTPGTLIGRPRKVKIFHTFHGHIFHSYYGRVKTRFFLMIERVLAAVATDRIVVISGQQLNEINERFGIGQPQKYAVVPLGLDLEPITAASDLRTNARFLLGVDADDIVVGFTGRLTEIKDLPLLLRTAKVCIESKPAMQFRFVIIGDGSLRTELETMANDLKISDRVFFLGNRDDVHELLAGLDLFVLTSKNEGTPLSLIEAMAAGVPVVAANVGGVSDLLGNTVEKLDFGRLCQRGIAVDSRNEEDLAHGLIYFAKNKKIQERIKTEALTYVLETHSIDRLVCDIDVLYRDMAKRL